MFRKCFLVLTVLLVALPSCTTSSQTAKSPALDNVKKATAKPEVNPTQEQVADSGQYRIASGDFLEIVTWKEPDLTKEVVVRIDGKITFPLLGDISAKGRTPMELKEVIQSRLQDYMKDPLVTVTVKNAQSQKFYIIGEVNNTGVHPMNKPLTLLQALALAGGFTEWANKKEILLIRHEKGEEKVMTINYYDLINGEGLHRKNIWIQSNDTIVVP